MPGMPAPYHHYAEARREGGHRLGTVGTGNLTPCHHQASLPLVASTGRLNLPRSSQLLAPMPSLPCLQRWGSLAFGDYVDKLQHQADEALAAASPAER